MLLLADVSQHESYRLTSIFKYSISAEILNVDCHLIKNIQYRACSFSGAKRNAFLHSLVQIIDSRCNRQAQPRGVIVTVFPDDIQKLLVVLFAAKTQLALVKLPKPVVQEIKAVLRDFV